jgi:hypothetical protein
MNRKSNNVIEKIILTSVFIFANRIRVGSRNQILIITEVAKTFGFKGKINRSPREKERRMTEMDSLRKLL